jgi:hypothetical protein
MTDVGLHIYDIFLISVADRNDASTLLIKLAHYSGLVDSMHSQSLTAAPASFSLVLRMFS